MPQTALSPSKSAQQEQLPADFELVSVTAKLIEELKREPEQSTVVRIPPEENVQWTYQVGPGDILNIVVWEHPKLTIPAGPTRSPDEAGNWVHEDGSIFYPYIGEIQVAGKSVSEIREIITTGLKTIIPRPQVDVSVAGFRSKKVYVSGAVERPGAIALTNVQLTVLDAISQSGGFSSDADYRQISIVRNNVEYAVDLRLFFSEGDTRHNPRLLPKDVLRVPKFTNNDAFLLGEVSRPGTIPLGFEAVSLTHALSDVGGVDNEAADVRGIFIFRQKVDSRKTIVYQLNAKRPAAYLLGTQFVLKPSDVVYVTSASATRWNRLIKNIIPSLSALNTVLLLDDRL